MGLSMFFARLGCTLWLFAKEDCNKLQYAGVDCNNEHILIQNFAIKKSGQEVLYQQKRYWIKSHLSLDTVLLVGVELMVPSVDRNAPRWLKSLAKFGYIQAAPA